MATFNPPEISGGIKFQYVNPDRPAGNTITSSLVANPKTAFASTTVIPESTAVIGGKAQIHATGLFGTGVVSLGLTVSIEMSGVTVASVTVTPALSLVNMPWNIDITATILSSGLVEVQGQASFSSSLTAATVVNIRNTADYSMSISGGVPVTISAQWGGLSVGGTISLRQMFVVVT